MIRPILFALLFVFIGYLVFALVAPLIFPAADLRKVGRVAGRVILVVGGVAGFAFGSNRRK